ncbi:DoxX family membrane protein [Brachybacterium subflavum]|uniref:DoxX family membrane protein n=1 Tax=Brachybacterium subflavum TaxID=2585206 RepID=UPI00187A41BC|nr:DoxX family membrane protein [Brachybacterium subflavum]
MSPGSGRAHRGRRAASAAAGAALVARLVLAALWLVEGAVKVHAGFGAADIGLVVEGARSTPRVPEVFGLFAEHVMAPLSGVFGIGIPVLELALGAGLALGWGARLLALASSATLALYWLSDQLVVQYPVMMLLGAVVLCLARGPVRARAPRSSVGPTHR